MTGFRGAYLTVAFLALLGAACSGTDTTTTTVVNEIPACSASYPTGTCDAGQTCFQGACVASASLCSPSNLTGTCAAGFSCFGGGCVLTSALPPPPPAGLDCSVKVNTVQPILAFAPAKPTKAGGVAYTYDDDPGTATNTVEVPYVQKAAITVDGLQFRDLNGNGTLEKYEDWRYPPLCRAQDLVTRMTVPQKVGLMNAGGTLGNGSADGIIADNIVQNIAGGHYRQGLTRFGFTAAQLAAYFNNVQALCEGLPLGIPAIVSGDPVHSTSASMAADGTMTVSKSATFSYWTSTLGLGAINDVDLTRRHGACVRDEFRGSGLRWQLGPVPRRLD